MRLENLCLSPGLPQRVFHLGYSADATDGQYISNGESSHAVASGLSLALSTDANSSDAPSVSDASMISGGGGESYLVQKVRLCKDVATTTLVNACMMSPADPNWHKHVSKIVGAYMKKLNRCRTEVIHNPDKTLTESLDSTVIVVTR